jgi:hypothetical protein
MDCSGMLIRTDYFPHSGHLQSGIAYRFYADDLINFLSLEAKDIRFALAILEFFASASRLHTNLSKCQFTPIRCIEE